MKLIKQLIGKVWDLIVTCLALVVLTMLGMLVAPLWAFMIVRDAKADEKEVKKLNRYFYT